MRHPRNHRPPGRCGTHLVEFALVVPIFFTFLFGVIDLGRAFMVESLLTNAARAGCRVGVLPNRTNTDINAAVAAALKGQGLSGTTTAITVHGAAQDASSAQPGDLVQVAVSVPVGTVSWLPGAHYVKGTLTGQFALPRE